MFLVGSSCTLKIFQNVYNFHGVVCWEHLSKQSTNKGLKEWSQWDTFDAMLATATSRWCWSLKFTEISVNHQHLIQFKGDGSLFNLSIVLISSYLLCFTFGWRYCDINRNSCPFQMHSGRTQWIFPHNYNLVLSGPSRPDNRSLTSFTIVSYYMSCTQSQIAVRWRLRIQNQIPSIGAWSHAFITSPDCPCALGVSFLSLVALLCPAMMSLMLRWK